MVSDPNCPGCRGMGVMSNAATGSPEPCPLCESLLTGVQGLPYWYIFCANPAAPAPLVLTASQTNVGAIVQIENDSDFVCDRLIASSTGIFSLFAIDKFSARPLTPSQNNPVFGENMFGTAQLPFWLPKPWLLKRTSTVQGYFNDRSAAGNTIQAVLHGYKVT